MNLQATQEALRRDASAAVLRLVALELGGALPSLTRAEMTDLQAALASARIPGALEDAFRSALVAILTGSLRAREQHGRREAERTADLKVVSQSVRQTWRVLLSAAEPRRVLRPGVLAKAVKMDVSLAGKAMAALRKAGYLEELAVDPRLSDKRGKFYRLTRRGERLAIELRPTRSAAKNEPLPERPVYRPVVYLSKAGSPLQSPGWQAISPSRETTGLGRKGHLPAQIWPFRGTTSRGGAAQSSGLRSSPVMRRS